jgi:hypothetical protein
MTQPRFRGPERFSLVPKVGLWAPIERERIAEAVREAKLANDADVIACGAGL